MLSRNKILSLFKRLNLKLKLHDEVGEIGIVGGAVMCLVYQSRESTRDVDALFQPSGLIRSLVEEIAEEESLPTHWLNDAVKGYVQPHFVRNEVLSLSHLRVWAPEPRYMLAMKCLSARWDTSDADDVKFLIQLLGLLKPTEVFQLIESYYPKNRIPPKTKFFIEELLEA